MKKKILNFVLDEKFTDLIIRIQDYFKDYEHEYYFVSVSGSSDFKQIKTTQRIQSIRIEDIKSLYTRTDIGAIFLHSLYSFPIKLIPHIPSQIKVFWFSWGYDIYERPIGNPLINLSLHKEKTKKELQKAKYIPLKTKGFINKIIKRILINGINEKKSYLKAIHRVDFFSGILPIEYDIVKAATKFRAERVEYKYQDPKSNEFSREMGYNGNNILIGNSAHSTNNHLDILNKLKDFNLDKRKLIVPLSYGGNPRYIRSVNDYGCQYFGEKWNALNSMMNYQKYQDVITSCNIGIFLIERQQGMGNINMMLRRGCKIFLSETSIIYKYLKSIGVKVFSFENELTQESLDTPLTKEEKERNRNIIMESCTIEAAEKRFTDIYKLI